MTVMLCEPCELYGLPSDHLFDVPGSNVELGAEKKLSEEAGEGDGELATGAIHVLGVQVELVDVEEEVLG